MSRTSQALKRLGVAGVVAATIGAGVPAFFATAASAAGPTAQLTITPTAGNGATGQCILYTVTPLAQDGTAATDTPTITVRLTENPNTNTQDVDFCDVNVPNQATTAPSTTFTTTPTGNSVSYTAPSPVGPDSYTPGSGNTNTQNDVGGDPDDPCNASAFTIPPPFCNPSGTDTATFTGTNGSTDRVNGNGTSNGSITFGLVGAEAGGASILAFVDGTPNAAPGSGNTGANGTADNNEAGVAATATFSQGGANAVTSLDAEPETGSAVAGQVQTITVTLKNSAGAPVVGVTPVAAITSGPNGAQPATTNPVAPAQNAVAVGCLASNNSGVSTCTYTSRAGKLGQDTIVVWVNQTSGSSFTTGLDTGEPNDTVTRNNTPAASEARNLVLAPRDATTNAGSTRAFTATVKDVNGVPVPNVEVTFTESGAGRFVGGTVTANGVTQLVTNTDENGVATATVTSATQETGTQEISASITGVGGPTGTNGAFQRTGGSNSGNTQCGQPAGAGNGSTTTTTAGNCSDQTTNTFVLGTPSPSTGNGGRGTLATSTPDIQPNIQGILTASGLTPNAVYELMCYSRPSTTYFAARTATTSAGGTTLEFRILPGTNTRCYVRPQGNDALASNSVVINVHTTLSLSAVRTAVRTYTFQGRNLPRRSGQLITLYRISNGQEIRTSNLVTDASGIYRVSRTFTGTGTFQFRVRTSQTLTNAAGASNIITVTVH